MNDAIRTDTENIWGTLRKLALYNATARKTNEMQTRYLYHDFIKACYNPSPDKAFFP